MTHYRDMDELLANLSPDVRVQADEQPEHTQANKVLETAGKRQLAQRFEALWRQVGGQELVHEHRFCLERRWRADYAHLPTQTLIELEGGTWTNGRHTRGGGYAGDCEKYNTATMAGWRVLRLTTDMVTLEYIETLVRWIQEAQR